jgi:hypothetical protein
VDLRGPQTDISTLNSLPALIGQSIDGRETPGTVREIYLCYDRAAAKAETYAGIRPPGKLEDVIAGLKSLGAWKVKLNSSLPRVEVVFLGLKRNIEEFPKFVRNPLYRLVKPPLKILRNALCGRLYPS